VALLQGLLRITKNPQDYGRKEPASHPGVIPVAKGQRAMLVSVIERDPVLEMVAGSSELPEPKQVIPQYLVGDQTEGGVGLALGQSEELLAQLQGRLVLSPFSIKLTESLQNREEVGGFARELTEFACASISVFHLWGSNALSSHQESTQGNLQCQFLLGALRGIRQEVEQLQPFAEVSNRFHIG
jgi:hypothetical protein